MEDGYRGTEGLSVWRRQIPQNCGGNEGEAELEKPLKETLVWSRSRRRRGAKTKRKKREKAGKMDQEEASCYFGEFRVFC